MEQIKNPTNLLEAGYIITSLNQIINLGSDYLDKDSKKNTEILNASLMNVCSKCKRKLPVKYFGKNKHRKNN